jgi:hypothetical protein
MNTIKIPSQYDLLASLPLKESITASPRKMVWLPRERGSCVGGVAATPEIRGTGLARLHLTPPPKEESNIGIVHAI